MIHVTSAMQVQIYIYGEHGYLCIILIAIDRKLSHSHDEGVTITRYCIHGLPGLRTTYFCAGSPKERH
jgi:hypothetical protein